MRCSSRRIAVLAPLSITALMALPAAMAGALDAQVITEGGPAQRSPQQAPDPAPQEKWFSGYEYFVLGEWVANVIPLKRIALLEDGTFVYATDKDLRDTTISTYTMRDGVLELKGDVFPGGSLKGRVVLSDLYTSTFDLHRETDGPTIANFRRASIENPEFPLARKAGIRLKDGEHRHANGRLSLSEAVRWRIASLTWSANPRHKGGLWPGGSAKATGNPGDFAAYVLKTAAYPGRLHLSVEPGTIVSPGRSESSVVIASIQTLPYGSQEPPPINEIHLTDRDKIGLHWRLRMIAYSIVPHGGMSPFVNRGGAGLFIPVLDPDLANLFAHVPTDRYDPRVQEAVKIISLIQRDQSLIRLRIDYSGEALLDEGVPEAVALVKQALKIVPADDAPGSPVIGLWTGDPANLNLPQYNRLIGKAGSAGNPSAYLTRRMIVRNDSTCTMYWTNSSKRSGVIAVDGSWKWRGGTLICSVSEDELSRKLRGNYGVKMRRLVKQETRYQLVRGKLKEAGTPFLMLKHPW